MFGTAFFGGRTASRDLDIADMPPADWCITTLQTLTNKYEHLTSVRKANPPYAEAVLNSFKSKLLNVVSSHSSLYDSDDASESEAEWPLGGCSSPYMDSSAADNAYDSNSNTSNYLSMAPDAFADSVSTSCYDDHAQTDTDVHPPALSPTTTIGTDGDSVASDAGVEEAVDNVGFDESLHIGVLPPGIEEALRRILASNSNQVLSDTFTTFSGIGDDSESSSSNSNSSDGSHPADGVEDNDDARYFSESGSCSPESLSSPEDPPEYLSANDSVDIFVNGFASSGGWEAVPGASPSDSISLTPCKRKRSTDKEDQQAEDSASAAPSKTIPRNNTLQMSPRKRSRSTSRSDAAAVPKSAASANAAASATPPPSEQTPTIAA